MRKQVLFHTRLKAGETKSIPLAIPTPMALKIDRRDLPNRVTTSWLIGTFDTAGEVLQVLVRFIGVSYGLSDRFGGVPCFARCRSNQSLTKPRVLLVPRFRRGTDICDSPMKSIRCSRMTPFERSSPLMDNLLGPRGG